jgi:hypothetical protein
MAACGLSDLEVEIANRQCKGFVFPCKQGKIQAISSQSSRVLGPML